MTDTVSSAGDEERLVLSRCPFCGATPHRGPTKAQHDQLHGEPFQRYAIWCPHGCARIERMNEQQAAADWNNRREAAATITRLRQERDEARASRDAGREVYLTLQQSMAVITSRLTASNAEAERLREIVSQCAEALDNGAFVSPSASVDFMAELPEEIRLATGQLREALKPFDRLGKIILGEAPAEAKTVVCFTSASGEQFAMQLDYFRAADRALQGSAKQ